ncbi:portal protein [Brevundimonas sp. BH3]|uniref:portal protein n=1 Tax=Brevundimonas sp. BH3 TaxID=3133089 RepID=UPI00324562BE
MKTAAQRFQTLAADRSTVLERAREASRLTIPSLIPLDGQNEHHVSQQPFQSVGANGLRALSARLLTTLFPINLPFIRLEIDQFVAEKMQMDKATADARLSAVVETTTALMEDRKIRVVMAEALRHLIIAGNVVIYIPLDGSPRIYRLDQFVVKRDATGQWIEIITCEKVHPAALPQAIRDQAKIKETDTAAVDLYTVVERKDGKVTHYQEVKGIKIEGTEGEAPEASSGWLAPRWLAIPCSDYGRGHVSEYMGDLMSLEDLSRAIVEFATLASRVVYMVNPASGMDATELAKAESGDVLLGNADHVTSISLDKSQDFGVVRATAETIEARINSAFLVQAFRDADRVTAEEIRAQSEELENTLGGSFSVLASELQGPIADRFLYIAAQLKLFPPLPEGIKPKILTGLAALGRAAEVNRLRAFINDSTQMLANPAVTEHFNLTTLLNRLGNEHGVTGMSELLKSDEQKQQEQQQAAQAQMTMQAAPQMLEAAMSGQLEQAE